MSVAVKHAAKVEGMGAIPNEGGVAFRVWAPHAEKVFVSGSFNGWSRAADRLEAEENGYWYGNLKHAKVGDEYRYVIINGEEKLWKNDPYARALTASDGNSIIVDPAEFDWTDEEFRLPPRNEIVVYELHVGTFFRSEPDTPGTFDDLIRRLDYLKTLGINVIELMPICEFEGDISWGYNMGHLFAVESAYGGPEAFKRFVNAAHSKGIGVIIDVVFNHLGPHHLDLWRFDGWYEEERGGIYFYQDERAYTPWGDTRPDFGRQEVRQYLRDNLVMWLEEYHLDGFRVDSTVNVYGMQNDKWETFGYLPEGWSFLQWCSDEVYARRPDALLIAEDLQDEAKVTLPTSEGGLGYGSQWDTGFHCVMREVLKAPLDEARNLDELVQLLEKRFNDDVFQRTIYSESHDEVCGEPEKDRLPTLIDPRNPESWHARKRASLGAVLTLTAPGIPMLFQGQEFMFLEHFQPENPLDWSVLTERGGIHRLYRNLISLRKNSEGQSRGLTGQGLAVLHRDHAQKLLVYHRFSEGGAGDDVVVVMNLQTEPLVNYEIPFPRPGVWKLRLNSDYNGYDSDFGNFESFDIDASEIEDSLARARVSIAPYTALVYSQDQ